MKNIKMILNKTALNITLSIVGLLMLISIFLYFAVGKVSDYQEKSILKTSQLLINADSIKIDSTQLKKELNLVHKTIKKLDAKIGNFIPKSNYILINTTSNEFYLYKSKKLVRKGRCSTGSYTLLTSGNNKQWIFKTPKGKFFIHGKTTDPIWIKPDWAFVEEGLPIPAKNHPSRYEYGVLGDYALSLGQGYLIHGTLYKRFLGMPVTHGCIRLNDDDLDVVYHTLEVGSRVYIY